MESDARLSATELACPVCVFAVCVQAVGRGARTPLVVGDMPFGSYEVSPAEALRTAIRFVKVRQRQASPEKYGRGVCVEWGGGGR